VTGKYGSPAADLAVRTFWAFCAQWYGSSVAVDDLTFTVEPAQVTGFLGIVVTLAVKRGPRAVRAPLWCGDGGPGIP
jgi:hypothetical protein